VVYGLRGFETGKARSLWGIECWELSHSSRAQEQFKSSASSQCDNSGLQLKKSKRVTVRRCYMWRPWLWSKVPMRLQKSTAKGHPRFFVREIHKG